MKETYTITYGDQAENHVGMEKLGKLAEKGFTKKELKAAKAKFEKKGYICKLVNLSIDNSDPAYLLIVRDGVNCLLGDYSAKDMMDEQKKLKPDTKAKMYGRVVNKHARYNLCFADFSQEPDYENGKGRVVAFENVPFTKMIREELPKYIGDKAKNLYAEGNYYYDIKKCGIGYHGDAERRVVVGVRLGETLPLCYQWYKNRQPVGDNIREELSNGDIYFMSEKAVGTDWKQSSILTLRHAAGSDKYIKV